MAICPRCNAKITEPVRFCPLCGASVASSALRTPNEQIDEAELLEEKSRRCTGAVSGVVCRFCKSALDLEGEFCEMCGAPVEEAAPPGMVKPKPRPAATIPAPPAQPSPAERTQRVQHETPPAAQPSATVILGVQPGVSEASVPATEPVQDARPAVPPTVPPPTAVTPASSPQVLPTPVPSPPPPDRTQRLQLETPPAPSAFTAQPQVREQTPRRDDSSLRAGPQVPAGSTPPAQMTQRLQLRDVPPAPPTAAPGVAVPVSGVPVRAPADVARPTEFSPDAGTATAPAPTVPAPTPPAEATQRLQVDTLFVPHAPSVQAPVPPPQPEDSAQVSAAPPAADRTQLLRLETLPAPATLKQPAPGVQQEGVEVGAQAAEGAIPPAQTRPFAPPVPGPEPQTPQVVTQPSDLSLGAGPKVPSAPTRPASATQIFHPEILPAGAPAQATQRLRTEAPPKSPAARPPLAPAASTKEPAAPERATRPIEFPPSPAPVAPRVPAPRPPVAAPTRPRTPPAAATRPAVAPPTAVAAPRKKPLPVAMLALGFGLGFAIVAGAALLLLRFGRESPKPEPGVTAPSAQVAAPPQEVAPAPSEAAPLAPPAEIPAGPAQPREARGEKRAPRAAPTQPVVSPQAAQIANLQNLAREAYARGNYVEPRGRSAIAYAKQVLALDPANEYGNKLLQSSVDAGRYQAQQAIARKDFATAHRLADEMAQSLPGRSDVAALKEDIAIAERARESARRAQAAGTAVVSFQVYHLHSRKAPNQGGPYCLGTLSVSNQRLKFAAESTSDGETHNFDVACTDVDEIKTNARVAARQGGFHVRTGSANYNFATKAPTSIVPALVSACQAF